MNGFLLLVIIAWVVLSVAGNKKKRAQQAARRRALEEQMQTGAGQTPAAAASAPARPTAPASPFPPQEGRMPSAAFAAEGETAPVQKEARKQERKPAVPLDSRVKQTMQSTLRGTPLEHTLAVSSLTGHAHQETSITGVQGPCGPETAGRRAASPLGQAASQGFAWDQNEITQGLVMAEILGKPRCMSAHRR